jgi:hypothetical protein
VHYHVSTKVLSKSQKKDVSTLNSDKKVDTATDQVQKSSYKMRIGKRTWVTAVQHEIESQHSRLDDVGINELLLLKQIRIFGASALTRRDAVIMRATIKGFNFK